MAKPPRERAIILCVGYPSTGKTTCTQRLQRELANQYNVELLTTLSVRESLGLMDNLYSEDAREKVYSEIARLTGERLAQGAEIVILDGNFNKRRRREAIYSFLKTYPVQLIIIECVVSNLSEIEERLNYRQRHKDDIAHKADSIDLFRMIKDSSDPLEGDRLPDGRPPDIIDYNTEGQTVSFRNFSQTDRPDDALIAGIARCLSDPENRDKAGEHAGVYIFDIGGVIQALRWEAVSNQLLGVKPDLTMDQFRNSLYHDKENGFGLYEVGQMKGSEFWKSIARRLGLGEDKAPDISEAFKSLYGSVDPDMASLIDELGRKSRLVILSNSCPELEEAVSQTTDFYKRFERIFFSHRIGFKKPDPRCFRHVLGELNARPSECVFVDDTPRNVAAASEIGMRSFLFLSPLRLRKFLK